MIRKALQVLRRIPVAPLLCFGGAWLISQTEVVRQFEWRTLDWRTNFRVAFQPPPDPRVAVVLYEDGTDSAIAWPPDRSVHGDLVEFMSLDKPRVITFDVIIDAIREGEGDGKMAASVKRVMAGGTKIITAAVTNPEPGVPAEPGQEGPTQALVRVEGDITRLVGDKFALFPFPQLRAVSLFGFADTPPGRDGIRREVPLVVRAGRDVFPSLALQTLMAYFDVPAENVRVKLGEAIYLSAKTGTIRLPISDEGRFLLNYRYDQDERGQDFPTFTYLETLVKFSDRFIEKKPNAPAPPSLAGRIVFVGQTVTGKADAGPSPRNAYAPLVLVHANLINNVLAGDFARRVSPWMLWLGAIALGYGGMAIGRWRTVPVMGVFAILSIVVYVTLAYVGWIKWSLWFPLVGPLLGFVALEFIIIGRRVLAEQRSKQEIKGMFGTYVSPQLVERMIKSGQPPQLGGHEEEITAYFSDIQGYSTFSERLTPAQLVELLNTYLTACTDIVQEEGGTLDKYIGDAVVAMFGAPIALPDHAYRACVTALRVQQTLDELRARWDREGDRWPAGVRKMRSRIGLNSGPAIIGNMGSRTRFNYTMTGDNVNLAARMESGAKKWGVYTMCTEATRIACEKHGGDRVVFRPLGRIVVQGRSQAVPIHEVVGLREQVTAATRECVQRFGEGLEKYYARDWEAAKQLFNESLRLEPNIPGQTPGVTSNPSTVYLGIVEAMRAQPLPETWDGVYVMQEK